ncbi:hypothetical protein RHRU231_620009 [Rhodococcus ruber]|uniref:Uncharacterized protein n=1 Tax=Rhodococcus ruber TaxID=1830 RepID=A0A098BN28_9NOCA|nr:hypothetical protein RHRU231_620009 [Rhodococcus ruber]
MRHQVEAEIRDRFMGQWTHFSSLEVVSLQSVAGWCSAGVCEAQSGHEAVGVHPREYRESGRAVAVGCTRGFRGAEAGCVCGCDLG